MISFLIPVAAAVVVVAACTVVLVRRDRRRLVANAESLRIEAAATRGVRENRRRAYAHRNRFLRHPE